MSQDKRGSAEERRSTSSRRWERWAFRGHISAGKVVRNREKKVRQNDADSARFQAGRHVRKKAELNRSLGGRKSYTSRVGPETKGGRRGADVRTKGLVNMSSNG